MKRLLLISALLTAFATAQEPVTLSLWTHDPLYISFFQKRVEKWNAEHDDYEITLETQQIPDPDTAFLTAVAAGEPVPDLIGVEITRFPQYMQDNLAADLFVDLTDRVGDRFGDFVEGRWTPYMTEGRIYGVESALSASAYYYQPEIFESRGLTPPTTWDEFLETGQVLAEDGIATSVMTDDPQGPFSMMFLQRGGQVFDENGEFVFGSEENRQIALEVLDTIRQGIDTGAFLVVLGNDFWGGTIPTTFSEGRLAGIVAPDWYSSCCLKPGVESMSGAWRIAAMPTWPAGGYSTSTWGGTAFMITQRSEHPDVAWSLLEDAYLTLNGQLDRYATIQFYPTMLEALEDPAVTEAPEPFYGNQKTGAVFAEVALDTPLLYQSPNRPAYLTAVVDNLPLFFDGTLSGEAFINAVVQYTEDEIFFNE